jgi:hypothetical protein
MSVATAGGFWEIEGSLKLKGLVEVKGLLETKGLLEAEVDLAVAFEVGEFWVPGSEVERLAAL